MLYSVAVAWRHIPQKMNSVPVDSDNIEFNVTVIIPAAGTGERVGSTIPKQYHLIHGKPLICHTIEIFTKLAWIQRIIVATDSVDSLTSIVRQYNLKKVSVVHGGNTRHRSIQKAVQKLKDAEFPLPDVVIVHDGVRPVVPTEIIKSVALSASSHGAAGAVCPLVSTVVQMSDDGFLSETLERSKYRASETPQAFQRQFLEVAYEKCTEYDLDHGTECLHLVHKYAGIKAKLREGTFLWKVTHKKDIFAAEGCLNSSQPYSPLCLLTFDRKHPAVEIFEEKLCILPGSVLVHDNLGTDNKQTYDSLVILHNNVIMPKESLFNMLDAIGNPNSLGYIVHVILYPDSSSYEELSQTSVLDLHKNGQEMATEYATYNKYVAVIHSVTNSKVDKVSHLVCKILSVEDDSFNGQTFVV